MRRKSGVIAFATVLLVLAACTRTSPVPGAAGPGGGTAGADAACGQPLCLAETVSLSQLLERPLDENVLKVFSVAADSRHNLVYAAGIMSRDIAVLDASTETWARTIDSGVEGRALKYLYMDEGRNQLYVLDATGRTLRRVNLDSGVIEGPVAVAGFLEGHEGAIDTSRGDLLIATKDHGIQAFGGSPLRLLWEDTSLNEHSGAMAYDPARDVVYVLDSSATGATGRIYVLNPATGTRTGEITFAANANERARWLMFDAARSRFLMGTDRTALVVGLDGRVASTIRLAGKRVVSGMLYDAAHDGLAVLSMERPENGQVAATGGRIDVYDLTTGRTRAQVSFGKKPHSMSLDAANGHLYIPNGDAATVWSVDTARYDEAKGLRLGDSLEQIAVAADGTAYLSSRLGGSYLVAYNERAGTAETFTAGTWPIPVQTTEDGSRLLVLNAWDSTLSVYGAANGGHSLLATIDTGLPDGTTDRLPELAIDSTHSLAYVAYPEFGKVVVVDFRSLRVVTTISLAGFKTGDTGGGPGQIQLTIDERRGRLAVYWAQGQKIEFYDGANGYAKSGEIGPATIDWKKVPRDGEVLFFDAARDRLFVGGVEIDGATLRPTGRTLAAGLSIFASDPANGTYWAVGATGTGWQVAIADASTLATRHTEALAGTHLLPPVLALDAAHHRLYVGHQAEAELDIYAAG